MILKIKLALCWFSSESVSFIPANFIIFLGDRLKAAPVREQPSVIAALYAHRHRNFGTPCSLPDTSRRWGLQGVPELLPNHSQKTLYIEKYA